MNDRSPLICRRAVLQGLTVSGAGAAASTLLAACGSDGEATSSAPSSSAGDNDGTQGGGEGGGKGSGTVLGPASEVAVGGGVIYADALVVVTQPTNGEYKGFTAVCTHQQCPVTSIEGAEIVCNCHGSRYSIEDGSVISGPAPAALAAEPVTVSGGDVTLG